MWYFISHGDCQEDAEYLKKLIEERFGIREFVINYVGPTIGAHSGPGTLAAVFYGTAAIGKKRVPERERTEKRIKKDSPEERGALGPSFLPGLSYDHRLRSGCCLSD